MVMERSLRREIDSKFERCKEDPGYYMRTSQKIRCALETENKPFSWWIEHPDIRKAIIGSSPSRGELIRKAKKGISDLREAWDYLHLRPDFLTQPVLDRTANLIDPSSNKGGYRTGRVSLQLPNYVPPNPLKVPSLITDSFSEFASSTNHIVERAATLHLRIAGIQPFNSGNKRLARLYQDKAFHDYGLPPAVIPAGERDIYIDLLEEGLVSLRDNTFNGKKLFFDYIGGKVNTALDAILNDLHY